MTSYWVWHGRDRFPLRRGESLVGRSQYCTIVIPDASVSREHAALRLGSAGLEVYDLGSRNGTSVNGARISEPRRLERGDKVKIGNAELTIVVVDTSPGIRIPTLDQVPAIYGNEDTTVTIPMPPALKT